jgi:hypothetical protein
MIRATLAVLSLLTLTACTPIEEPGPAGIEVRNDTDKTIWIDTYPETAANDRHKTTVGDQIFVATEHCTQRRIEAQTRSGDAIAVLDREWCPGQIWFIRGQDDWSLKDLS